jgi:hypothetical protein
MYLETVDSRSIDFVSSKDYGRIMARGYRSTFLRYLLKKLIIDASYDVDIFVTFRNLISVIFCIIYC